MASRSSSDSENDAVAEGKPVDHTNLLNGWLFWRAVIVMNFCNVLAFLDQMSIMALLATVSADFNAGNSVIWASTAQLVAAVNGQCIFGYMSDVFGRKQMLLIALVMLLLSSLLCGLWGQFGEQATVFFLLRAVTGVATGSISNLVNIAQNDFLSAERRAKFQGIQDTSAALGSDLGFTLGAVFARYGWEKLYYVNSGLTFVAVVLLCLYVPSKAAKVTWSRVRLCVKTIDWIGILTGSAMLVTALIYLTQGRELGWTSPMGIGLLVGAIVSGALFLANGWKQPLEEYGVRPIVPSRLFNNRTISVIYAQNLLLGAAYYTLMTFLPMYLEFVLGYSSVVSAALMWPYVVTHGAWSTGSAYLIRALAKRHERAKSFIYVFAGGFALWTIAAVLFGTVRSKLTVGEIIGLEIMIGLGTGSVFQNSINAIRNQVSAYDQAVAIGTRNALRFKGGAIGTAAGSTIMAGILDKKLLAYLKEEAQSAFTKPDHT
ncbi:hypothetical protein B0A50_04578 [Salinomyces thailandicus]|uniref:Major facilitator superfamily (MFS) profile domain-containing protein n=1 Tax=Salinomyces thailandicus TaxID=706561 RepID=A0A4U0TVP5_9PEZI|nr:hypothetical protein B0A50_04578 [Salinomyces thailandica]